MALKATRLQRIFQQPNYQGEKQVNSVLSKIVNLSSYDKKMFLQSFTKNPIELQQDAIEEQILRPKRPKEKENFANLYSIEYATLDYNENIDKAQRKITKLIAGELYKREFELSGEYGQSDTNYNKSTPINFRSIYLAMQIFEELDLYKNLDDHEKIEKFSTNDEAFNFVKEKLDERFQTKILLSNDPTSYEYNPDSDKGLMFRNQAELLMVLDIAQGLIERHIVNDRGQIVTPKETVSLNLKVNTYDYEAGINDFERKIINATREYLYNLPGVVEMAELTNSEFNKKAGLSEETRSLESDHQVIGALGRLKSYLGEENIDLKPTNFENPEFKKTLQNILQYTLKPNMGELDPEAGSNILNGLEQKSRNGGKTGIRP
jgi:hypothetical protein